MSVYLIFRLSIYLLFLYTSNIVTRQQRGSNRLPLAHHFSDRRSKPLNYRVPRVNTPLFYLVGVQGLMKESGLDIVIGTAPAYQRED